MIKGELTLELLMIDDESENTTKSRRKAKKSTDTFKQQMKGLLLWSIAWMPDKCAKKIRKDSEEENEL